MTRLWRIDGQGLAEVSHHPPKTEAQLEGWIADDPSILGLDLLIIDRQRTTAFGGRIDLLGIDREGSLTVIEVKRDRTPRDVIAQILDYASWVSNLSTRDVHGLAGDYLRKRTGATFSEAFGAKFDAPLPETLNSQHNLLIVAASFDESSKRIVEYLAKEHDVSINTAFFGYFRDGSSEYLTADFLMDQAEVVERAEAKTKPPWTGFYYVNAGHDPGERVWDDMQRYGFIAAGYGRFYSGRLDQLEPGDPIFVYHKGAGYIGYGVVTAPAVIATAFTTAEGKKLEELDLKQPRILHDPDDPEQADYLVRVDWKKTFPLSEAKWLEGGFANQNVVCKLREPKTLDFLMREFGATLPGQ